MLFFDSWRCWSCAEQRQALLVKVASIREVVLGAPLRVILKHLASRTVAPDMDPLVALVHRPKESFFVFPQVWLWTQLSVTQNLHCCLGYFIHNFFDSSSVILNNPRCRIGLLLAFILFYVRFIYTPSVPIYKQKKLNFSVPNYKQKI